MFFAGMAQGFSDAQTKDRQLQAQIDENNAQREQAALLHLSQIPGADNADIRAHATAAMLNPQRKPGGFLASLTNQNKKNPMLPTIQALMGQGVEKPVTQQAEPGPTPTQPSPAMPAAENPPPGVEGQPIPQVQMGSTEGSIPQQPGRVAQTGTQVVPRQFLSGPEIAGQTAGATAGGQMAGSLEALKPYLTPEQLHTAALGKAGVHVPMTGQFMGNQQKPDGSWVRQERYFDANTGTFQMAEVPIATPTALQAKPKDETIAEPGTGRPIIVRTMPDGTQTRLGYGVVKDQYVTYTDPQTQEVKSIPAPAVFQRPPGAAATGPTPLSGAATPSATTPAATAPPGAPGATPARRPQAAVMPPAAGAVSPATSGPAGVSRGRARKLIDKEGAVLGPDGNPRMITAQEDEGTGKYYDPRNPGQELTGFIPGDMGKSAVQAFASGQSTIDTINLAINAIDRSGLAKSTDPRDTLKLWQMYRGGENPVVSALGSLTNLASIQGASQYVKGNSRSFQMFTRASQHTALTPTDFESSWGTTPIVGQAVTPMNAMRTGHPPWDSPAALVEKLQTSRQITQQGLDELRNTTGKTPEQAIGAGTPPAAEVPPEVQQLLRGAVPGRHTLSDGSVWETRADGSITKAQ